MASKKWKYLRKPVCKTRLWRGGSDLSIGYQEFTLGCWHRFILLAPPKCLIFHITLIWKSNPRPFGEWANTLTTQPHRPGPEGLNFEKWLRGPAQTLWETSVTPGCARLPISTQSPGKAASPGITPFSIWNLFPRLFMAPPSHSPFCVQASFDLHEPVCCYYYPSNAISHIRPELDGAFFLSVATICSCCRFLRARREPDCPKRRRGLLLPALVWSGLVCSLVVVVGGLLITPS